MMVTVFWLGRRGLLGGGFGAGFGGAGSAVADFSPALGAAGWTKRDARDRLAAQRIVVEDGKAGEDDQKQAQQHGKCLDTGKRQPETALPARRLLSERCAQIVGRLCHGAPRINRADDTTAGQGRGRYATREPGEMRSGTPRNAIGRRPFSKKGGPKAALFAKSR